MLRVSCSWPTRARAAGRPGPPALHPPSLSPSSLDSTLARTITTTKQNRFANQHHFPPQNLNCVRGLPSRVITLERAVAPQFSPQVFHVWYGMVGCRQMLPITAATLAEQAVSGGQKPSRSCESATSSCLCRRPAIPSSPARPSPMLRCPFPPISSLGSNWPACPWHRTSHPQSLHVNEPVSPNARLSTCPMQRGQAKSQALSFWATVPDWYPSRPSPTARPARYLLCDRPENDRLVRTTAAGPGLPPVGRLFSWVACQQDG